MEVEEYGENTIVLLTKNNASKIEEQIKRDDDYFPFSKAIFDYYGKNKIMRNDERSLFAVIREIDRDNSTNVWRYKTNRESFYGMISYIEKSENKFFSKLEEGDCKLPDDIVNKCGTAVKSLSSKVCKYLSEFIYAKDNFYINDKVIRHMLLFYLDYYGVEHSELKSNHSVDSLTYVELYKWLEKLHIARNQKYKDTITKSELDHILWYCYKSFDI